MQEKLQPAVNAIFVINLKRRPDRERRMRQQLRAMTGLSTPVFFTEAVDGRNIDTNFMENCGARLVQWKLDDARSTEEVDWSVFPPWDVRVRKAK